MRCSFTSQLEHMLVVSPVQKLGCQSNTYYRDRRAASAYAVFVFEGSRRESVVGWVPGCWASTLPPAWLLKVPHIFNLMITLPQPLHGLHWVHLGQGRQWDAHPSEAQGQSSSFPVWRGHPYFLPCDLFYPSPEPVPLCRISLIIHLYVSLWQNASGGGCQCYRPIYPSWTHLDPTGSSSISGLLIITPPKSLYHVKHFMHSTKIKSQTSL